MDVVYFGYRTALYISKILRLSNSYTTEDNGAYINYIPNVNNQITAEPLIISNKYVEDYDDDIDVIITNKNSRYATKKVKFHVCTSKIPRNQYIKISKDAAIPCPELLFLQLADVFSFETLVMLGNEFCGCYVSTKDEAFDMDAPVKGFASAYQPITSTDKILRLITLLRRNGHHNYFKGINKATEALKCITNNSFSPRESMIYAMLSGPRKYGMFGIKDIKMNNKIKLSYDAAQIAGQSTIYVDLCIPKYKIAIEYDSRMFHEQVAQGQRDKRRADALTFSGWKVFSLVSEQLNNIEAFDTLCRKIMSLSGKNRRITMKNFDIKFHDMYYALKEMDLSKI